MIRCMGCMEEFEESMGICPYCGYQVGTKRKEVYYLETGSILHGQYLIGKVLGYGGFGITYIGWDMSLNRKVAVKEYLPSDFATRGSGNTKVTVFSEDTVEQFQSGLKSFIQEARKLASLNDVPEIVDIYDCFIENNTGYIIMEYLYGRTIKEVLADGEIFNYSSAVPVIKSVLRGLEAAHKEGIIHRDVAPDNVFLTADSGVRLIDFGAARYATTTRSRSLSIILKPGYAPEEQYRSKGEQGPWTDVYGAGATLYRMVTGIRPQDSIDRLSEDLVKTPSELGIEMPQSLENTIMNAINVHKEDRFSTAGEFMAALESDKVERIKPVRKKAPKIKTPVWVKALAAACGVLVLAVGIFLVRNQQVELSDNQVQLGEGELYLKDMTGLSYEEAAKSVSDTCELVISGKNYSKTVEYNKIVSQIPEAGEIIHKGDQVKLIMSGGMQEVSVPDVEAMTQEEAIAAIEAQGLVVTEDGIISKYNATVEKGRIYLQTPEPQEKVEPGTVVTLGISKGVLEEETAVIPVPDLKGMTKKEAVKFLEDIQKEFGFTFPLGDIKKEYNRYVPKGEIISQSLTPGEEVRTDHAIHLVISKGPRMVEMPDVVYMTQEEAEAELENLNLEVEVDEVYNSSVQAGSVVSQSVEKGTEVKEGTKVTISVSLGAQPTPTYTAPSGGNSGGSGGGNTGGSGGSTPPDQGGWNFDDNEADWPIE